jgi:hypothetical protein
MRVIDHDCTLFSAASAATIELAALGFGAAGHTLAAPIVTAALNEHADTGNDNQGSQDCVRNPLSNFQFRHELLQKGW